jgi:hypothetical protein
LHSPTEPRHTSHGYRNSQTSEAAEDENSHPGGEDVRVDRKPKGTEAREVDAPPRGEDRRRTREQTHSRLAPPLVNQGQRMAGGILRQFVDSNVIVGWSFIIVHKDILLTKYFEKQI